MSNYSSQLLADYAQIAQAPIEEAYSLPFAVYKHPDIYVLEIEKIFKNEWVFIVSEQELNQAGDYFAFTLADEPIVIIQGQDGTVRALSNLCRHRGTILLDEGFGNVEKNIVCPYHAWTYSDDGDFKGAPFTGNVNIDKKAHCLLQFSLESWHGMLFVHLGEPIDSLSKRLAGIDDYLYHFGLPEFNHGYRSDKAELWNANWKLAMENAMESYHLFKVHKTTLETVTPTRQAFDIAGYSEWTLTGGEMKDTASKLAKWFRGSYPKVFDNYVLISIPPSFVGILTSESLSWVQVLPQGSEQCIVRSAGISNVKVSAEDKAEKAFVDAFFAEDKEICERVQKGMGSTLARGGKLVTMEKVVADFHQFLGSRLFNTPTSGFYEAPKAKLFLSESGDEK
ncbi:aromatic ring-hydroxylating dioxygenase subunit alpha [Pseudoalteromonas luteoviolacea]|uniref:aromatic ring-hydroxylating oxygenase subunit alpha n=1 Tax=Pseudoalteromonas luteoviolacea TaxID=43657 RepID=UPI001B36F38C|nr:aromatic ring-hydroxylating dioxygenase subunit alpha [Pseudoalteromonas luteoviolacea]MBQ4810602.1 aromatic ring-hydroxylating dioxygenase subunit alpha [Pseudoalteromonas luteoviolacea]